MCWLLLIAVVVLATIAVVLACKAGYANGYEAGVDAAHALVAPELRRPD